jgi:hypothetical protein
MRNLPGSGDSLTMIALFGGVPSVGRAQISRARECIVASKLATLPALASAAGTLVQRSSSSPERAAAARCPHLRMQHHGP